MNLALLERHTGVQKCILPDEKTRKRDKGGSENDRKVVGIGRKSDEFPLIDFEFRWRSQGGSQSRAASQAVFSNHNIMLSCVQESVKRENPLCNDE